MEVLLIVDRYKTDISVKLLEVDAAHKEAWFGSYMAIKHIQHFFSNATALIARLDHHSTKHEYTMLTRKAYSAH